MDLGNFLKIMLRIIKEMDHGGLTIINVVFPPHNIRSIDFARGVFDEYH
jgi:hypothetical protein